MNNPRSPIVPTPVVRLALACLVAAACGQKDKKDQAKSVPAGEGGLAGLLGKGEKAGAEPTGGKGKNGHGKKRGAEKGPEKQDPGAQKGLATLLGVDVERGAGDKGEKGNVKFLDLLRQLKERRAELERDEEPAAPADTAVYVVPDVKVISLAGKGLLPPAALKRQLLKMNAAIFDATEGQVRVGRFTVMGGGKHKGHAQEAGTIHIHAEWGEADDDLSGDPHHGKGYAGMADQLGRPGDPTRVHAAVRIDGVDYTYALGQILAHEFMHAFLGAADEYAGPYGQSSDGCPDRTHACIMDGFWGHELCTPRDHDRNRDTRQHHTWHESCWETLARFVKEDAGKTLRIPDAPRAGPRNPPAPKFAGDYL